MKKLWIFGLASFAGCLSAIEAPKVYNQDDKTHVVEHELPVTHAELEAFCDDLYDIFTDILDEQNALQARVEKLEEIVAERLQ